MNPVEPECLERTMITIMRYAKVVIGYSLPIGCRVGCKSGAALQMFQLHQAAAEEKQVPTVSNVPMFLCYVWALTMALAVHMMEPLAIMA